MLLFQSTPGRIRTCGLRFRKPQGDSSNAIEQRDLRKTENTGVPTMVPSDLETWFDTETGAELAQVVIAWPTLPAFMRQGILAMIQAAASADLSN